jgi:hypothetical protein
MKRRLKGLRAIHRYSARLRVANSRFHGRTQWCDRVAKDLGAPASDIHLGRDASEKLTETHMRNAFGVADIRNFLTLRAVLLGRKFLL